MAGLSTGISLLTVGKVPSVLGLFIPSSDGFTFGDPAPLDGMICSTSYTFTSDGTITTSRTVKNGDTTGYDQTNKYWAVPVDSALGSLYEMRGTSVTGSLGGLLTTGSWYPLTTSNLGIQLTNTNYGTNTGGVTLELRRISDATVIDTKTISFQITRNS